MSTSRLHLPLGALAGLCVLVTGAGSARAQRGVDAQTFRPSLDGFGMLVVERAETGRQWDFGFKLTTDYAQNPLRLALHDAGAMPGERKTLMEWQATLHLGAHFSFTDWLEFALEVPVSAQSWSDLYGSPYKDATAASPGGPTGFYAGEMRTNIEPPGAGVLDPRVALKVRTRRMGPVGLALVAAATVPLGDDHAFLGDTGFTIRPAGVVDLSLGAFALVLNVGAILRGTTTVLDPLPESGMKPAVLIGAGHELTASLGAQLKLASWVAVSAEAYALIPVVKIPDRDGKDVADKVLGVLGALRFFPGRDLALSLGGGAGLLDGPRHDAFRVVLGLSWTPGDTGRGGRGGGGSGDRDGDGISDGVDLCPEAAEDKDGFEDADGCPDPDNDGDGVPDVSDRCPAEPEDRDGFQDADGCPDPDNDGDGVPDIAKSPGDPRELTDQCPDEPEDKDGFEDDDGCPDPDNDGDGIPDARDRCPDEPETANGVDDEDGCPDGSGDELGAGLRPGTGAQGGVIELVFFDKNKSKPTAPSYAALDRAAKLLREGDRRARLESFLDPGEKRAGLGGERVRAVQAELQKRGVDAARIDAPSTAPGKHRNGGARRVEIVIVEAGK